MTDKLLNPEITRQVKELFDAQLIHPVEILYFSKNEDCDTCEETRQLLEEVTSTSEKLHLSLYGIEAEAQLAKRYKVELSPSLVITSYEGDQEPGYALRFAGIPSGYEFGSFIQAILMVSKRDSGLKPEIRQALKSINKPIQLKVFVTPT